MKKLLIITMLFGLLISCSSDDDDILPASIELNMNTHEVVAGQSFKLSAVIEPANTTNKTITWSSSDPSKATVNNNGEVTTISEGTVTITASIGNVKDECVVTILSKPKYIIAGTITDFLNGNPITTSTVTIDGGTVSSTDNTFEKEVAYTSEPITVVVKAEGYEDFTDTVTLTEVEFGISKVKFDIKLIPTL